ncbi:MAG: cytochrome c [Planctomycetota bacterium]
MQKILLVLALVSCAGPLVSCGAGGGAGKPLSSSAQRGRKVYLESSNPTCGSCHRLNEAGTRGAVGPDLDKMDLTRERVVRSVTQGVGVMPTQRGVLKPGEIQDVADYVMEARGRRAN